MSTLSTAPDRIRLPVQFDASALQAELASMNPPPYIYYYVDMLCIPPDLSVHTGASRVAAVDHGDLSDLPVLQSILTYFRAHTTVTLARLLRLEPGGEIKPHTDPTLGLDVEDSVVRLTLPITDPENVIFWLNDEPVEMQPGECWYLKLNDPHRVLNRSAQERVNLTIDVVPNAWLLEQLAIQSA